MDSNRERGERREQGEHEERKEAEASKKLVEQAKQNEAKQNELSRLRAERNETSRLYDIKQKESSRPRDNADSVQQPATSNFPAKRTAINLEGSQQATKLTKKL